MKTYPSSVGDSGQDDRWQRIADVVGTRTRRECILRCKELAEQVRAKKAALAAVKKPSSTTAAASAKNKP
ncbi:unnamed protein product [Trichobilharzia regenti]|nr:unnamed protein product [Trichobilharzia regenti]